MIICQQFIIMRSDSNRILSDIGYYWFHIFTHQENVRKLVNAKYCEQFAHTEWKDGSLVHVHITAEQHKNYERRIKTALDAIQKRCG